MFDINFFQKISLIFFIIALIHTFLAPLLLRFKLFKKGVLHYLTEVEFVFPFWAMLFCLSLLYKYSYNFTADYLKEISFIEPIFVWVMLLICSCKPLLEGVKFITQMLAEFLNRKLNLLNFKKINLKSENPEIPKTSHFNAIYFFLILCFVPLLGSIITEVAAMTLAAMMLKPYFKQMGQKFAYLAITTLCLNISIAGAITTFAAPPVLMVANKWGWDLAFMLENFAWRAFLAVPINAGLLLYFFRKRIAEIDLTHLRAAAIANSTSMNSKNINLQATNSNNVPVLYFSPIQAFNRKMFFLYALFLVATIILQHSLLGLAIVFALFLSSHAFFKIYHQQLLLKEASLVALFLSGLMVLGKAQAWWVQAFLAGLSPHEIFATGFGLSIVMDNAAITYLASLLPNLSTEVQYKIVAAALTAGGLSILANAPNLLALGLLKKYFKGQKISHLNWFIYAIPSTLVAVFFFLL